MAKVVKARIKLFVDGGSATPAPPVGSALGQHQVNIMDFCKKFNAATSSRKGEKVPVNVIVYTDKSFDFVVKTPSTTGLIKQKAGIEKGSGRPHDTKVGKISMADVEAIARVKMADLNATDIEQAKKIIAGSARSMGIEVV
jgi:large subunit ribosomal protein L11